MIQNLSNRKSWSEQEDQTIKLLVSLHGIEDWTQISNKLKEEYPLSTRSGKQCRQRWYNHLSPDISKNPWTIQQENKLFRMHREQGNKWKDISKDFVGRTDNDLKNHFYSTLRKSLRRLNKSLGQKNSTSQMREIKPSVLSTIMHFIYGQQAQNKLMDCLKDVPSLIFEFANIKPTKSGLTLKDDQMRDKVLRIFDLVGLFNQQYEKSKNRRKEKANVRRQKLNIKNKIQQTQINDQLLKNDFDQDQPCENSLDSLLSEQNISFKNDNTEISMTYSSTNSPYDSNQMQNQHQQQDIEEQNEQNQRYDFMFVPEKSGVFCEHDEILSQFHDPEEPSVINEYAFNQTIVGKAILHKIAEQQQYCAKIVDQLLDGAHR